MQLKLSCLICIISFNFGISEQLYSNSTFDEPRLVRRTQVADKSGSHFSIFNYKFSKPPKKKNIDPKELKLILGREFDPEIMSIDKPPEMGAESSAVRQSTLQAEVLNKLRLSNLSHELQQIAEDGFQLKSEHIKLLEKWLLKKAACPVRYTWEDLGAMFWPRYVRRGDCMAGRRSCSWPPGMHCVPSATTPVAILRWQCKLPKGRGKRRTYRRHTHKELFLRGEARPLNLKCYWVRVPYPVTNECICTC